jgi:hypothetical protein
MSFYKWGMSFLGNQVHFPIGADTKGHYFLRGFRLLSHSRIASSASS